MIDFEIAVKQEFKYVFLEIVVRGCRIFFKRLFCLILIPMAKMDGECINLQNAQLNQIALRPNIGAEKANRFSKVFEATFF